MAKTESGAKPRKTIGDAYQTVVLRKGFTKPVYLVEVLEELNREA